MSICICSSLVIRMTRNEEIVHVNSRQPQKNAKCIKTKKVMADLQLKKG